MAETLDGVVENCVNSVGADLNTASPALLSRVAGLNATVCNNIVKYREENGAFSSRSELKKVPKLGPKAFEQVPVSLELLKVKIHLTTQVFTLKVIVMQKNC